MKTMRIRISTVPLTFFCLVSLSLTLATRAVAQEIRLDLNGLTIVPANWNTITSNTTLTNLLDFGTGAGTGVDATTANFQFYAYDSNIWTAGDKGWVAEDGGRGAGFRTSAGTATVTFDNLPGSAYRVEVVASNRTDFPNSVADIQVNGSFADADKDGTGEDGDDYPLDGNGHNNWLIWNAVNTDDTGGQIQVSMAYASGANGTVINAIRLFPSKQTGSTMFLFRVERQFFGPPRPPATSPGGAGRYVKYLEPYASTIMGQYFFPPATATAQPGNPIGGAFTLPTGFISFSGKRTHYATTWYFGYTTVSGLNYYNGPGYFAASHGAPSPTRLVFPTTLGNPTPNYGTGSPVTPTTTFSGRYDFSRGGSINVTPGPNRFGGTMKLFHRPAAFWYQYVDYYSPDIYKVYGSVRCQAPPGVTCYPGSVSNIGDITSSGMGTRFLLNVKGTGTGPGLFSNTAKATTPVTPGGSWPTEFGDASYVAAKEYRLGTIHPWTTGFAVAKNPLSPFAISPQLTGYDTTLGGAKVTVTHVHTYSHFNTTASTVLYYTATYKQYLKGVTRVVSMVRPRLKHRYYASSPILSNRQSAEVWTLKVFFLPEPAGLLLVAAGLGCLVVLHRLNRRN
jgi:hypothetical protein